MSTEKATENSGFLDGRDYTAAFVYEFCALLVGNGVYAGELAPTATNDNMTITHGSGHAWINGVCYKNTTPFALDIAKADGALNRYDSLMLRLDLSANETYAIIVQGEYATAPTPPACTRNAEIYDLKICDIYVPAGCTKITQDLITDTRMDASVCGVPVFPVDHLDLTTFYKQVAADLANFRAREQADFAAWVTGQEESHLATMHDLVEIVRMTSDNSVAEILELLRQLNELVEGDTVGELITAINEKLPKTGGTMTGNLAMGAHRITDLADPEDSGDAATKGYTDDAIEKLLKKSGGIMTGEINMNGHPISGLNEPTEDTQAANKGYVDSKLKFGGVSMANSVVMEYSLGTSFTDEQSADIRSGKFEKVHVGGYWTINGRKYWAAHADYRLHCGDTELTTHHMLVIPDKPFYNGVMNDTSVTTGAYYGSKMKTSGLADALATVKADFGADHILTHRIILANAISNGASSGWAWYDSQIDLMNEKMVYGSHAWGGGSQNGYDTGADKSQLALFQARPDLITIRENWWLRDVRSAMGFGLVDYDGRADHWTSANSVGVRPAFLIY